MSRACMPLEDSIDMAQRVRDILTQARLRDLWCLLSSEWRGIRDVAVEDCNASLTRYGQVLKSVLDALSTASLDDLPNDLVRLYHIFLFDNKSYVMNIAHGSDQWESVCHDYDMLHHLFEDIIELRKSARCTASTSTGDCVLPNNSSGEEEDADGEVEEVDMVMDAPDFDIDVEQCETVSEQLFRDFDDEVGVVSQGDSDVEPEILHTNMDENSAAKDGAHSNMDGPQAEKDGVSCCTNALSWSFGYALMCSFLALFRLFAYSRAWPMLRVCVLAIGMIVRMQKGHASYACQHLALSGSTAPCSLLHGEWVRSCSSAARSLSELPRTDQRDGRPRQSHRFGAHLCSSSKLTAVSSGQIPGAFRA